MKPYRRTNKAFMVQQLRSASRLGRMVVWAREFGGDIHSLWRHGAHFPTFLKLIATLVLCLIVVMPLIYPIFVAFITFYAFEGLYLSWWLDQPWRFSLWNIMQRLKYLVFRPYNINEVWKVQEVLTRGILVAHSLATSVDYLCIVQGLLDET